MIQLHSQMNEETRVKKVNLHRLQQGFFLEIPNLDCKMYNDISSDSFLFVEREVRQYFDVNQDRNQYEIFVVLFSFENKYQLARKRANSSSKTNHIQQISIFSLI